jgi:hypothetical protein
MNDDLLALALPFDKSAESSMVKGGTRLTYIPVSEVIHRLNEVLAYNWSYTVQSYQRDPLDPDFIVAHVSMKVYVDGEPIIRDGFGGVKVKRTRDGGIVDLGDEYKGAVSDALKKAAQSFGVGLYLARHEDKTQASTERTPITNPTPSAYKGENIKALFPDAVEVASGDVVVKGNQHGELPNWCLAECAKKGYTLIYDNRDKLSPEKNRPWFKDVDSNEPIWAPRNTPLPTIIAPIVEWDTEEEPF